MSAKHNDPVKRILVVGDLMLDMNWTIENRSQYGKSTSQTHGGVSPYFRNYPSAIDFRPGGAGLAALALTLDERLEVHLLSAACGTQELDAFRACGFYLTDDRDAENRLVAWHPLDWEGQANPVTTIKWRFNSLDKLPNRKPFFFLRIDQDPPPESRISDFLPRHLEDSEVSYEAILVMDFGKGAVSPNLIRRLAEKFPSAIWGIDSKRPELLAFAFEQLVHQQVYGFLNREEAASFFRHLDPDFTGEIENHDYVMRTFERIFRFEQKILAVKLDRQGAVVLQKGRDVVFSSGTTQPFGDSSSVGAGDFYAAGFMSAITKAGSPTLDQMNYAGMSRAYQWIKYCDTDFWLSSNYRESSQVTVKRELPWPQDREIQEIVVPDWILCSPEDTF